MRHKRLRVVFTTEIHGYNLELLYSHCRTVSPSLLVVEAANGTVVGGFCSDAWQVGGWALMAVRTVVVAVVVMLVMVLRSVA